ILKTFDDATAQMDGWLTQIQSELQKLDATLVDAAKTSGSKMHHQLQSLRDKAARAEIRKSGEIQHHADELVTLLYPRKTLQEREVGVLYFLLRYGTALLPRLQQQLRLGCPDHQVIRLQSEF
ncbi:MAG TPA: bacillithiol biosynthesis BshC, partial [Alphaproteobacteria bacterium]|nr:bacillithiol biosynthesis BshC [Alphaproteobacteria bacterium]